MRDAIVSRKLLSEDDLYLFNEGRHFNLYQKMGAQVYGEGVHFSVWAQNARFVSVIGDFNLWNKDSHPLQPAGNSGIWTGNIPEAERGQCYKYYIASRENDFTVEKADPFAFTAEIPPHTASVIWDLDFVWSDRDWMKERGERQAHDKPISIYELHIGSWRRRAGEDNLPLTYRELADELIPYLQQTGFTHVEFLPVMEYPFGGSWGYQITGYYAPTSRYGSPQDFMHLIDRLHQSGIGVILDWVPAHFPGDEHGLACFDGTPLYEHADPRQGFHPDWNSHIFNYGSKEVRSFLISNAMFWLDKYHADGLRVDAVASMLYLDYSRKPGEWAPNIHGDRTNLEAVHFLKELNKAVYGRFPGIHMIAEESTAWPGVSSPTYAGGLGFGFKWDMGWMNDTIRYFSRPAECRKNHRKELTFRTLYMNSENFILALSHDEVVYGKSSLLQKMPGDRWMKFANLRCLYACMYAQPGKKLLFMGNEFAPWEEWNHDQSLDWNLLEHAPHRQMQAMVSDLNMLYRQESVLQIDCDPSGFQMIDGSDTEHSVISWLRCNKDTGDHILCAFNMMPVPRDCYRIGVPLNGQWQEIFNSDLECYGGSNHYKNGRLSAQPLAFHEQEYSISMVLPPLSGMYLKWMR